MVIAIVGIVAGVMARVLAQPVSAYLDTSRRAGLTARADAALHRVTREVRQALPNSLRVSADGAALELLRVANGGRYRREAPDNPLDFTLATDDFDILGTLTNPGGIDAAGGATQADCLTGTVDCLVIYNTGQTGANAYAGDNIAAIRAVSSSSLTFSAAAPFPWESPAQRFYVVDEVVSFVCDGGAIYRYDRYPITTAHTSVDTAGELAALGARAQLLSDQVDTCEFAYAPGTATRNATLRVSLVMSEEGESVRLLQQVHVSNAP